LIIFGKDTLFSNRYFVVLDIFQQISVQYDMLPHFLALGGRWAKPKNGVSHFLARGLLYGVNKTKSNLANYEIYTLYVAKFSSILSSVKSQKDSRLY
jgi:hypothetical protein